MAKQFRKAGLLGTALLSAGLLLTSLAGSALALHPDVKLYGPDGTAISDLQGDNNAFSVRQSCFTSENSAVTNPAGSCHGDATAAETELQYTYNDIERHSYHAQLASNDQYGWKAWNPDGDKWESGPGPKGKNWVQGQGHVGAW